ncbi:MAG TPA: hypothetical protein VHT50_17620 [Mycobacterium sp.]|jgi:hypothetical protein|nr:hypothetical protein [Mycobacterium sp.]
MTASLIRSDHTASLFDGEIVEENYLLAPETADDAAVASTGPLGWALWAGSDGRT